MKPSHVETIVAIADARTIRGAALVLHKSQPAVSSILKNAEEGVGARIFLREPSGMVPTDIGKEIIARSRTILNEFRRLEEQVRQIQGDMVGSVRIIVSPLAAVRVVPRVLASFKRKFPKVRVHIDSGQTPTAFGPLKRGDADIVIAPAPVTETDQNGLVVEHLFSDPLLFITGGASKFAAVTSVAELNTAHWLMFGPKEREPVIQGYLETLGVDLEYPMTCSDSVLSVMGLLTGSDMVCTCPKSLFEKLRENWDIVQIPVPLDLDPVDIAVMTSSARPPTSAVVTFRETILKEAGEA